MHQVVGPLLAELDRVDRHQQRQRARQRRHRQRRHGDVRRQQPDQRRPRDEHQGEVAGVGVVLAVLAGEQGVDLDRPEPAGPPVQDPDVDDPLDHREQRDQTAERPDDGPWGLWLPLVGDQRGPHALA